MTYDEFIETIVESEPEDWIYDDSKSLYIYKPNINISIIGKEVDYGEDGLFYENWAMNFPNRNARKKEFELCYNGNEIETFYTVYVDGMRVAIPYPDINKMTITQKQYRIGAIVNIPNEGYGFDRYLRQSNITVQ